ncbi:restriction endonuclease subunit S [Streptomyces californicus]|uniref:restriction endonuclease subunit S n=1 Tax=Streptomyces californicus TaxID=67351 RepID=UPI0036C45A63
MAARYVSDGIPFLRSLNIKRGRIDFSSLKYIDQTFHDELSKSQLRPGDLVIVRTGDPGTAAVVPEDIGPLNCSDLVVATPHPEVDAHFLCYAINETAQDFIRAHTVGAVQQHFNVKSAKGLVINLPPPEEQRAIAGVLRALDGKIAVNERIAATSMKLGEARFSQASLIAEKRVTLGDAIELKYGKSLPATRRIVGDVPVFGSGGISGSHNEPLVKGPGIIVGRKGTVGTIYWSESDFFPIDTTFYVACRMKGISMEYMYFTLRGSGLEHMNSDSAVPGLNRDRALAVPVNLPAAETIQRFTAEARTLFELQRTLEDENRTLATLRDTLLPQLMSGRLRVRDAEKIVEDHA